MDDGTKDVTLAHQIAALLRFASAMTPEMWEHVEYWARGTPVPGLPGELMQALDTLRQALGERQA